MMPVDDVFVKRAEIISGPQNVAVLIGACFVLVLQIGKGLEERLRDQFANLGKLAINP